MSPSRESRPGARSLWIWVVIAFAILISAWSVLIVTAMRNQPEVIEIEQP